jgi:hypothetical protein
MLELSRRKCTTSTVATAKRKNNSKRNYALDKTGVSPVHKTNTKDKVKKMNFTAKAKEGDFMVRPDWSGVRRPDNK